MTAQWTDFAWQMLSQTADYVLAEFGNNAYSKFLTQVDEEVKMLERFPFSGQLEPLLKNRLVQYRSIVVNSYNKIVYFYDEENDIIQITDFWDVRREPSLLVASL